MSLDSIFLTCFGFGEASSHGGPRKDGHQKRGGRTRGRDWGEEGEVWSDRWTRLSSKERKVMQNGWHETLQVEDSHCTHELFYIICEKRGKKRHENDTAHSYENLPALQGSNQLF